jgi:NAD(P)-dependent dehydrogenase (short-subunit alcohol dehydrogenase family)
LGLQTTDGANPSDTRQVAADFPCHSNQEETLMSKVVLITGGSRGIGAATALLAAQRGYDVAISYRQNAAEAERVVRAIEQTGQRAIAIQADVTDADAIAQLFDQVDAAFGRLDALINSAGIGWSGRIDSVDAHSLQALFATNVFGTVLASREAIKRLSTQAGGQGGVIINISSMAATIGGRPGSALYAATKAAVDTFTTGLAKEVAAEGIRAISVRPGFTRTDMTEAAHADPVISAAIVATIPQARAAEVEEIARPIVWLLSDEASFISGAHLDISGGGFHIGGQFPSNQFAKDQRLTAGNEPVHTPQNQAVADPA